MTLRAALGSLRAMPNAPSTAATTEVLTIGDELLRGELVDSNSAWLAGRLGELGLPASRFSTASDELGDIVEQLRSAAGRCSALMVSGVMSTVTPLAAAMT